MKKNKINFHLNNKGFAITSIIYSMLLLFIVLMTLTISVLSRKNILLNKGKEAAKDLIGDISKVYNFYYTGNYQTFIAPTDGYYKVELWGAQGSDYGTALGGKGAYTQGTIYLKAGTELYVYVGGMDGYNGGGAPGPNYNATRGGGATDIRLIRNNWDNFESLKSRLMVAAGGGGSDSYAAATNGGFAGGLTGGEGSESRRSTDNSYSVATGGTQTSGGQSGIGAEGRTSANGGFGYGATSTNNHGGGGGSGYYGGGVGGFNASVVGSGAGGSSFISGYDGCDAIAETSTINNIIHTGQSIHYSGYKFENANMIAGNSYMPNHNSNNIMLGNSGNGHAKITYIRGTNSTKSVNLSSKNTSSIYFYQAIINNNSFSFGGPYMTHTLELDSAGYDFDWNFDSGILTLKFCNLSNECYDIFSTKGTGTAYNGHFYNTEAGYLIINSGGCTASIDNINYKGTKVNINYSTNFVAPSSSNISLYSNCTLYQGNFQNCTSVENNSTITGNLWIRYPNRNIVPQIKVDNLPWIDMNIYSEYYYTINEAGTYKIKLRLRSGTIYSEESEEFTVTIQEE